MDRKNIVILGSAHPLRGGLASYNERLAQQFQAEGHGVAIYTFSLQYPNMLFPGKTQYSDTPAPQDISINVCVNSINPFNWLSVGRKIKKQQPDLLIIKYWTPFMSPCFGTIARMARSNGKTKVICIVDNLIPHEKHFYDSMLTAYFAKTVDGFVAMSQAVLLDIQSLKSNKPARLTPHPLYDNFGEAITREEALQKMGLDANFRYLLYFGFIRNYKGLDNLLEAFADARLREFPVKLIVAGEFYEDEKPYLDSIEKHNLGNFLEMRTHFIPNDAVVDYFCAADMVVQPYKSATQSGVTQIAYHFSKPMLVTNVGGLSEIVPNGVCGYVVEPNYQAIADALVDFFQNNKIHAFDAGIEQQRKQYQWDRMTHTIYELLNEINNDSTK